MRLATAGETHPMPLRTPDGPPLYLQVRAAIQDLVLTSPLDDEGPLPPEAELMSQLGVSRGTLRRATEDLARAGLLRFEPGNGTFVVQSTKVRILVRDQLAAVAVPDSRFDLDLSRFVADFDGRERCDAMLVDHPLLTSARSVFVAPDNSLESLRALTLGLGKQLIVPTYGMRRGFISLDGGAIAAEHHALAATLDGMERFGTRLEVDDLLAHEGVQLVLTGAVAVTKDGVHFGGGEGNLDLEWAILAECEVVSDQTPVVVVVHDCQVLEAQIRPNEHDVLADLIVTPSQNHECASVQPKPAGIYWHEILANGDRQSPYVAELAARREAGRLRPRG